MQLTEYTDMIQFKLGGSVVWIEIQDDLDKCVKLAFDEIKQYVNTPNYITLPYAQMIDLSEHNVYSVTNVLRSNPYNGTISQDLDVFSLASSYVNMTNPTNYAKRMMLIQQRNTISTDLDFVWDAPNKHLYVSVNPPFPATVTIQYTKAYQSVEEITDPYWEDFIKRMALAYAKEVLGRIRGKYQLNSAQYNLDPDKLLQEGLAEQDNIRNYLKENVDIVYPLD